MRLFRLVPAIAVFLLMSACGSSKEDNQVTETRMDNLDSLEGTISDDMINTDESTDEAAVEAAPVDSEPAKAVTPETDAAIAPDTGSVEAEPATTQAAAKSK
jgi:hypothetical protein